MLAQRLTIDCLCRALIINAIIRSSMLPESPGPNPLWVWHSALTLGDQLPQRIRVELLSCDCFSSGCQGAQRCPQQSAFREGCARGVCKVNASAMSYTISTRGEGSKIANTTMGTRVSSFPPGASTSTHTRPAQVIDRVCEHVSRLQESQHQVAPQSAWHRTYCLHTSDN